MAITARAGRGSVVDRLAGSIVKTGTVYLVGAGPGDPGLLTRKGERVLGIADLVVYDRLLDPSLLELAVGAETVFVGKERGRQALRQSEINDLLVVEGLAGKTVVRLKGGDPFVFGRGGEEAQALAAAGVPFEVVPGVTSAVAAAAYAGIPVTHRGVSTSVTIVTGSEDPTKGQTSTDWAALAKTGGTLVALMGWATLPGIVETLRVNDMPECTPVALVQWGTWSGQRTVTGQLSNIVERGKQAGIGAPVVVVIGEVAGLRREIGWFDRRPLWGKRVLVTRSRTQASRLIELLAKLGAEPVELPSIEIGPLDDYSDLDRTLKETLGSPHRWVIFTSVNSVDYVWQRLRSMGMDARYFAGSTVGSIGPATGRALRERGIEPDFVPKRSVSEDVIAELSGLDWASKEVLLPGSAIGRDALASGMADLGADVRRVAAYTNTRPVGIEERAREAFERGIDVVTFTSSSTVRNLLDIMGNDRHVLEKSLTACIGPITAATATELDLTVDILATEHNVEGLADALVRYFAAGAAESARHSHGGTSC